MIIVHGKTIGVDWAEIARHLKRKLYPPSAICYHCDRHSLIRDLLFSFWALGGGLIRLASLARVKSASRLNYC